MANLAPLSRVSGRVVSPLRQTLYTASPGVSSRTSIRSRRLCIASATFKAPNVVDMLKRANDLYTEFDADGSGELGLDETVRLLNSDEYKDTFNKAGFEVPERSAEDIAKVFKELDKDGSGSLSRQEFVALWAALAKDRLSDPRIVALALCTFLDSNGDGKIQVSELKRLLPLLMGPKGAVLAAVPVPDFLSVDYKGILGDEEK